MRFRQLFERIQNIDDLNSLKNELAGKIKVLPQTPEAFKTLREIEDLLQHVHAGGRLGLINNILKELPDEAIQNAQKELARYIASIDMSPQERADLFDRWKNDKLVNISKLLSPGLHTFNEIINGYETNPAIKQLTDDLMRVEAYGHGKGEFILNVFSKSIGKPESGKGDLIINDKIIEVKTTDSGGARFGDQEVQPGEEYLQAVLNFKNTILAPLNYSSTASAGINAITIQELYNRSNVKENFKKAITPVVTNLFPKANVSNLLKALFSNDSNELRQQIAIASLTNYLNIKGDYGVLYIDISREPYRFIFFKDNKELNDAGLRLDISTQYLVTTNIQRVHAQFTVIPSTRLAAQQLQQIIKPADIPTLQPDPIKIWTNKFAKNFGIYNQLVIDNIEKFVKNLFDQGLTAEEIVDAVRKDFNLKYTKKLKRTNS